MNKPINTSGFKPVFIPKTCKILVYIDKLEEKKTSGGILLTSAMSEAECFAKSNGVVVEVVFENKRDLKDFASKIKIGDVVSFKPFAGINKIGDDKGGYRLLTGEEIQDLYVGQGNEYKDLTDLYLSKHENVPMIKKYSKKKYFKLF